MPQGKTSPAALAAFLPHDPATRTATVARAAAAYPNVNYTAAPPTRATARAKIAAPTGATAGAKIAGEIAAKTGATARTIHTPASPLADDDARTAGSAAAATAESSCSAVTLGRSCSAHDQGKAK